MRASPPSQLTEVATQVERRLESLLHRERSRWHERDPRLAEAVEWLEAIVVGGGKRLRAAFCYWAWHGAAIADGGPQPGSGRLKSERDLALDAGAGFELMHAFALVHDDIMDDSHRRRGQPTVHVDQAKRLVDRGWRGEPRRFGEGVAILVGDLGHVYADQMMGAIPAPARTIWDELRIEVNLGQYLDLRSAAAGELDADTAAQVSMFKSGLYTIVRPLQLGAMLHHPSPPQSLLAQLDDYGRPLGRAFQLRDDLLGVLGDENAIGKPVGEDLREGKPTELLAVGLQRADGPDRQVLALVGQPNLDPDQVDTIVGVLHRVGAIDEIETRIDDLVDRAVESAAELPFNPQARQALTAMANYVGLRDN